jgi:hypothetical protein
MAENSILCPLSLTSWFDPATGQPKQANAFFYKAQTLDPIVVYTDSALTIPFTQPVITTGYSRMPPIYVGEFPHPGYRVRVFDQFQVLIEDLDMLPAAEPTVPPPAPDVPDPTALARTGDMKAMWSNHASIDGWVECSGKTIGSALSNATGMAHDDCYDLFIWLWGQDAYNILMPVKGASADGDWQLNKQIATPDMWGRLIGGVDGYDAANNISVSGRLDKATWDLMPLITEADKPYQPEDYMKPWMLGATGGEGVHKLTKVELAVHFHDWIDDRGHTHVVTEPNSGQGHKHVLVDPEHTHGSILTSPTDSNGVLCRTDSNDTYTVASGKGWAFGGLTTQSQNTGITMNYAVTGVYLSNWNATTGQVGHGTQLQYIGAFSAVPAPVVPPVAPPYGTGDGKWHNKTENYPITNDGSNGTDMGDVPHNTVPPTLLVCWYIKL